MSCLGVHFALTDQDVATLRAFDHEHERLEHLQEDIEERYMADDDGYAAESDKAWDAMHRLLADGTLAPNGGAYPLNHAVLGGESLYSDVDYIMSLKTPAQVQAISAALAAMTETEFRRRYDGIDADSYDSALSDEDFEYTWEWFQSVRDLYARAATEGRYVLFTVDQ
ncbi:MAG: YfbM family protein [Rhodocyclaceae bacterium]